MTIPAMAPSESPSSRAPSSVNHNNNKIYNNSKSRPAWKLQTRSDECLYLNYYVILMFLLVFFLNFMCPQSCSENVTHKFGE